MRLDHVRLVAETAYCQDVKTLAAFFDPARPATRLTLADGRFIGPQSAFPAHIGKAGGRFEPDWLTPATQVFHGRLELFRLAEAYYFPEFGVLMTPGGEVMQATFEEPKFLLQTVDKLPFAWSDGTVHMELPANMPRARNVAVTMAWGGQTNYGHFVVDCLSSIALFQANPATRDLRGIMPALRPWHLRHLEFFPGFRFKQTDAPVIRIDNAVWCNCIDHFLHISNALMTDVARAALAVLPPAPRTTPRIYLSRRGMKGRRFDGEAAVEAALATLGFVAVAPETLSVDAQIALFAQADYVVGFTGAAFANVIYCPPTAQVIEIQTAQLQGYWVRNLVMTAGGRFHPFFAGDINTPEGWDLTEFMAFVRQIVEPQG